MLRAQRWAFAYHPTREQVEALASFRTFPRLGLVDVVIVLGEHYAYGYRGVLTASPDLFAPDFILRAYSDTPVHVLRAALALPLPSTHGAPQVPRSVPDHLRQAAHRFTTRRAVRPPQ